MSQNNSFNDRIKETVFGNSDEAGNSKPLSAEGESFESWIERELPRATGFERDQALFVWEAARASAPSSATMATIAAMDRIQPDVQKIQDGEALAIMGEIMAYVTTDQRIHDLIQDRISKRRDTANLRVADRGANHGN